MDKKQTSEVVKQVSEIKEMVAGLNTLAANPQDTVYGKVVLLNPDKFSKVLNGMQKNLNFVLDQVLNPADEE